jgi:hypothetical protein
MTRYFYLAASLAELDLLEKPPLSFAEFLQESEVYLAKGDEKYISILRELIDIENIRRLFLEQTLDDRGNLAEKALDEAILAKVNLPSYAVDFLDQYVTTQSRLDHFAALYSGFFANHTKTGNEFIDQYLQFEYELRLWISLLRAQRMGLDFSQTLQFEDSKDPLIMGMLVQNQNSDLRMPGEFKALKDIFSNYAQDPLELHKKIETFRLHKITELTQDRFFSIDCILGFMAKLLIVEQWQALNQEEGLNRLHRFTLKH